MTVFWWRRVRPGKETIEFRGKAERWAEDRVGVVWGESGIVGSGGLWSRGGLEALVVLHLSR